MAERIAEETVQDELGQSDAGSSPEPQPTADPDLFDDDDMYGSD